jgi:5-(carboxyamino)imidazole ribonucleotide synthase
VTFEFENVPAATAAAAAEFAPVRPAGAVLHTTQNRIREKTFLRGNGFPVTDFRIVRGADAPTDFETARREVGVPGVLKTADFGYDGKGQSKIDADTHIRWRRTANSPDQIYEAFVDFEREVSVVAARGTDGTFAHWGLIENSHRNHILDLSVAPADVPPQVAREAEAIARGILEQLGVVGVLCVELFLTRSGKLLVNELAPRPHNSGHLTIDASVTSQFEQQLRAVCGLPLGSTHMERPAAMANLLGDLWERGEPNWEAALSLPGVKLHLYGKAEARPGRKMGHLTALADTGEEAARLALRARELLGTR